MITVFLLATGGCGACTAELWSAVATDPALAWSSTPGGADVFALTGTAGPASASERALAATIAAYPQTPIVVVGECATDGGSFGRVGRLPAAANVVRTVGHCPPLPAAISAALLAAAHAAPAAP